MKAIRQQLESAWYLFEKSRSHLAGKNLDEVQIEVYDLAFSLAELKAAKVMLEYAGIDCGAQEKSFKESVAFLHVAETIANLHTRLRLRPSAYGLVASDFEPDHLELLDQIQSSESLQSLGQRFRSEGGGFPPDHLDEEKGLMRRTFRKFADEEVAPLAEQIHREDQTIPDSIIKGVRELGCFGLSVPQRYGGLNPDERDDSLGMVVVTEELSRASLGAAGSLITRPEIMSRAILEGGSDSQKIKWLPKIAKGEPLVAISVTEPGTGSDVASVSLKATKVKGGWLLNGGKTWCTFAGKAGAILVLARTEPEVKPLHRGLSLFVVEKPSNDGHEFLFKSPGGGVVSGKAISTLGYRGMHSFEMFYEDFFVPDANLVGEEDGRGNGFYYTMRGFSGGRLQTSARAAGVMQAAFEAALRYAEDRHVFGRSVASYPLTLQKIAKMGTSITVVRQAGYHVAGLMDEGDGQLEASLLKLYACRMAEWVTREALQIHGGMGYAEESPVSRYFVDARVLSIFEGAEETLALRVVGKALLDGTY